MSKCVAIYSGGMDSLTLIHYLLHQRLDVHALSFDYGQRHAKELNYARKVAYELCIPHFVVDLKSICPLLSGSALTSPGIDVPEGHYEEESMKATVVPNRNMIMLSVAIGYGVSIQAPVVYFGAHAGDHAIYPDCRAEFVDAMNMVSDIANYQPVAVKAPFIEMDKGDIAIIGKELGVDYSRAWTCYKGLDKPCGKCGACQERAEAMAKAGIEEEV